MGTSHDLDGLLFRQRKLTASSPCLPPLIMLPRSLRHVPATSARASRQDDGESASGRPPLAAARDLETLHRLRPQTGGQHEQDSVTATTPQLVASTYWPPCASRSSQRAMGINLADEQAGQAFVPSVVGAIM